MSKQFRKKSGDVKTKSAGDRKKSAKKPNQPEPSKKHYSEEQWKVITTTKKVAAVIAGAGTGKTSVLCGRASHTVEQGNNPNGILILTFTKSAQINIQERLEIIPGCKDVKCSTFHAFCFQFLRKYWEDVGFNNSPSLLKDSKQKNELTDLINRVGKKHGLPIKQIKKAVANAMKRRPTNQDDVSSNVKAASKKVITQLKSYKKINNYLNFDDMLSCVAKLVQKHPKIASKMAQGIDHLLVDELQDITTHEVEIIYALASRIKSTVLVGDKKQAIFAFRGSDLACWDKLDKLLKKQFRSNFKRYYLTESFRVPNRILRLSNAVGQDICNDPPLISQSTGSPPYLFIAKTAEEQGQFINNQIKGLVNKGVALDKIAILGRTRKSLFQIKNQLTYFGHDLNECYRTSKADTEKTLRALIRITRRLYSDEAKRLPRKSLQLLVDYLALPQDVSDSLFQRIWENGWHEFKIPKKTGNSESLYRGVGRIREYVLKAKDHDPEAGTQLLIDALNRFIEYRYKKETPTIKQDLSRLKVRLRDYSAWDEIDFRDIELGFTDSGVNLYTIHGSKGKEWEYVFIINMVDKYLPFKFNKNSPIDEELRVFYTAITRPSKCLFMIESPLTITSYRKNSRSDKKSKKGNTLRKPSPFVDDYQDFVKTVSLNFKVKRWD